MQRKVCIVNLFVKRKCQWWFGSFFYMRVPLQADSTNVRWCRGTMFCTHCIFSNAQLLNSSQIYEIELVQINYVILAYSALSRVAWIVNFIWSSNCVQTQSPKLRSILSRISLILIVAIHSSCLATTTISLTRLPLNVHDIYLWWMEELPLSWLWILCTCAIVSGIQCLPDKTTKRAFFNDNIWNPPWQELITPLSLKNVNKCQNIWKRPCGG